MGKVNEGPTAHRRLDELNSEPALMLSKPARPLSWMVGKKAALATPMLAFAAAMRRSAAEMSGLRSSNSEGKPGGIRGGAVESALSKILKLEAFCPTKTAKACSKRLRCSATAGSWACVVLRIVKTTQAQ